MDPSRHRNVTIEDRISPETRLMVESVMPTNLSDEQRRDLEHHGNRPVAVIDPVTNDVYFLVPGAVFERFRALFEDDVLEIQETYPLQSASAGETGWDDSTMDAYNNYDAHER